MGGWGTIQSVTVDKNSLSPNPKYIGFPGGTSGKESACNAEELGSIPGLGRSFEGGHGNPLQYSCLENPTGRGAWQATVHGVAQVGHDLATKPPLVVEWLNSESLGAK